MTITIAETVIQPIITVEDNGAVITLQPTIVVSGGEGGGAVNSVFGRIGAVIANVGDYTTAQVTEATDKNYVTDAEKIVIGNTSGTNTGDQVIPTQTSDLTNDGADGINSFVSYTSPTTINQIAIWTGDGTVKGIDNVKIDANNTLILDNNNTNSSSALSLINSGDTVTYLTFNDTDATNNSIIDYKDNDGSRRNAITLGNNHVIISNRASNGDVEIRANTVTAGIGGEISIALFKFDLVTLKQNTLVQGNITANAIIKSGGTGLNVLLDDGTTTPLSGIGGGGSTKTYINASGKWAFSNTTDWEVFHDLNGLYESNSSFSVSDNGSGLPDINYNNRGIIIPKGHKVNSVIFICKRGFLPITDIELAIYLRTNNDSNDNYSNSDNFAFTLINNEKFSDYGVSFGLRNSKCKFLIDNTGGVAETNNKDAEIVLYAKPIGGNNNCYYDMLIEIETI